MVDVKKEKDSEIYSKAYEILKCLYGPTAEFRDGQYEAIEATLTNKRSLVVQRTGWGKSLVYFICTKILRERKAGVTLVISPLLALMDNQIEAAQKVNLKCDVLNSTVKERKSEIIQNLVDGTLDLVLITPETLFTADIKNKIVDGEIKIGLMVIDEAHCISDWGHDFRLKYMRLKNVIQYLPANVPLLATTATANDRVVNDLKKQLGGDVFVSRGPLSRESLSIQILNIQNKIDRYAWILENINKLPGSGIIYCLTQRDCDYLSNFLNEKGICAVPYYSSDNIDATTNLLAFSKNEVKVIVSTIKLGMGYDKGDIAFVIHFQMPANIVSYYQQIGRAGRNIGRAYTFLMYGTEDEEILNYFIRTAFPAQDDMRAVFDSINESDNGLKEAEIKAAINLREKKIDKALMFLENDGLIRFDIADKKYYATGKPFFYDGTHYNEVTQMRYKEMNQLKELIRTNQCYSKFVVNSLDDYTADACGKCKNCCPENSFPETVSDASREIAAQYMERLIMPIEPRKKWITCSIPNLGNSFIKIEETKVFNKEGICLAKYGDAGYGELVKRDKYHGDKFCDELIGKSSKVLKTLIDTNGIKYITNVPSLRSNMVETFTKRLAERCGLEYISVLGKKAAPQQKEMENSAHQLANAYESFFVIDGSNIPDKVILVDDIVDSKWTFTVCGYRLMEQGCKEVYPFALADSSQKEAAE